MGLKTKDASFDVETRTIEPWGQLRLRALSAKQIQDMADTFGTGELSNKEAFGYYVELIAASVVNDDGQPELATDEDKEAFANCSFRAIQKLATAILAFNGIGDEEKN